MEKTEYLKYPPPRRKAMPWTLCCVALLMAVCSFRQPMMGRPAGASLEEYLHAFESSYHAVNTLSADFTQTYSTGERTRVESGTVRLAKGGRMRWDYREPEAKLFVSDGKDLSLYIPAENQVTRSAA